MRRAIGFLSAVAALSLAGCIDLTGLEQLGGLCVFGRADCGDYSGGSYDYDPVTRVVIEPDTLRLVIGETGELIATAYNRSGDTTFAVFTWTASDTTIAGLSSEENFSGRPFKVTARKQGEALVVVSLSFPEVADTTVVLVR